MGTTKKGSLGQILSASQIITAEDVSAALEEQKRSGLRFGEALIALGIVTQEDIDWALSNQLDLPYIRLKKEMIDPDAIKLIPGAMARSYNCIPLIKAGAELNVALADPLNKTAIEALERASGCSINVSVALIREIREMIDFWYGERENDTLAFISSSFAPKALEAINADTSGAKLFDYLLLFMVQNKVSSLSMEPMPDSILFRAKKSGISHTIATMQPNHYPLFIARLKKNSTITSTSLFAQSGILKFMHQSHEALFQVLTLHGDSGEYVTLNQQKTTCFPKTISNSSLTEKQLKDFIKIASSKSNMTLFASRDNQERCHVMDMMLAEIDTTNKKVLIVCSCAGGFRNKFPRIELPEGEDPQAELISNIALHKPDILVMEDATGMKPFAAASKAAMAGVRLFVGLNLNGFDAALNRLHLYYKQQIFIPQFINGLIYSQGIDLLCQKCRTEYTPTTNELKLIPKNLHQNRYFRAVGCNECNMSGIDRRILLFDILSFDSAFVETFENAINAAEIISQVVQTSSGGTMDQGALLLANGAVSPEGYMDSLIL